MTKKSAGRLLRDVKAKREKVISKGKPIVQESEPSDCFIELHWLHRQCATMLLQNIHLTEVTKDIELIACIDDLPTFNKNIQLLSLDLLQMSKELTQLYDQHKDKNELTLNPDDVMQCFDYGQQYSLFMQRYEASVSPNVLAIVAQLDLAGRVLTAKQRAAADLQNVDVISDVVVTEPIPDEASV